MNALPNASLEELKGFLYNYYTFDACHFLDWSLRQNIVIPIRSLGYGWKIETYTLDHETQSLVPFGSNCFRELLWQMAHTIYQNEHRKWPHEP